MQHHLYNSLSLRRCTAIGSVAKNPRFTAFPRAIRKKKRERDILVSLGTYLYTVYLLGFHSWTRARAPTEGAKFLIRSWAVVNRRSRNPKWSRVWNNWSNWPPSWPIRAISKVCNVTVFTSALCSSIISEFAGKVPQLYRHGITSK